MAPENGWGEWQRHVLAELERLSASLDRLREDTGHIRDRLTRVEERAALIAMLVSAVAAFLGRLF